MLNIVWNHFPAIYIETKVKKADALKKAMKSVAKLPNKNIKPPQQAQETSSQITN